MSFYALTCNESDVDCTKIFFDMNFEIGNLSRSLADSSWIYYKTRFARIWAKTRVFQSHTHPGNPPFEITLFFTKIL